MGQIDQVIEAGEGECLKDGLGLIGWLIPMFVDAAIQFANPFLWERMKPVDGTKSCECALILFQHQQVNLCLGVRSAVFPKERGSLDQITKPFQLNEKRPAHWDSPRIVST